MLIIMINGNCEAEHQRGAMSTSANRYSLRSILLHWITVIAIFAAVGLGLRLEHPPEGWGDTLYRLHWSFGMTVLFLVVLRVINRLKTPPPAPYAGLTPMERKLSVSVHHLLYVLMVVVPVLGWLGKSAYGGPITIFGLFDMPALLSPNEDTAKRLLGLHKIAVKVLMLTIALHIAGALNHALIKRDGVLRRMLPGG